MARRGEVKLADLAHCLQGLQLLLLSQLVLALHLLTARLARALWQIKCDMLSRQAPICTASRAVVLWVQLSEHVLMLVWMKIQFTNRNANPK